MKRALLPLRLMGAGWRDGEGSSVWVSPEFPMSQSNCYILGNCKEVFFLIVPLEVLFVIREVANLSKTVVEKW